MNGVLVGESDTSGFLMENSVPRWNFQPTGFDYQRLQKEVSQEPQTLDSWQVPYKQNMTHDWKIFFGRTVEHSE